MFSIIISEKGGAERRESYDRTEINVGRVQGNDLMLPKGNVSKRHARLLYRDGRFIVTDLKSTNGTYVNGRKIAQATIVREGDKIYIGDFVLRIEATDGAQAGASAPGVSDAGGSGSGQHAAVGGSPTAGPPPLLPNDEPSDGNNDQPHAKQSAPPPRPTTPPAPPGPAPASIGRAPQEGGAIAPPPMMSPPVPPPLPSSGAGGPIHIPMQPPGPPPPAFVQPPLGPSSPPQFASQSMGAQGAPLSAQSLGGQPAGASPFPAPPVFPSAPQHPGAGATTPPGPATPSGAPGPLRSSPPASHLAPQPTPSPAGHPAPAIVQAPSPSSGSPAHPASGQVPGAQPSSKRVEQPPVDASQAQEHRGALAKLVERTLAAVDLSSLANGEAPDAARVATVDRALREKAAQLRGAGELPAGIDPEVLVAEAKRELIELGPIGPLLEDEDVEEVQVIRHDHVVALHGRRQIATEIAFTSEQAVARVVRRICARSGRPLAAGEHFVERRLERGGRMFGVLPPASGEGHMLVFRKPQRAHLTLDDLVRSGSVSRAIATLLAQCVAGRANILVTGAVNSGATALLGALAGAGAVEDRVIVLQEEDELIFNQPHTVSILIGDTAEEGARAVRAAIRVRPDRLVVGTFAGHVVAEVVDAVGDGVDGVLAAARAPTLRHLIQRAPADLAATRGLVSVDTAREWIAAAFDLVIEVAKLRDGRQRVMRVSQFGFHDERGHRDLVAEDVFTFNVERTAAGGTIEGTFHATGVVPRIVEDLSSRGTSFDLGIFKR